LETGGSWPPIVVQRSTMMVVDGTHRLAAANALGLARVRVLFFEGDDDEARVEALRLNRGHGLPLTLQDRRHAASELLSRHHDWSDARVAEICSLSPKTVGALRRRAWPIVRPAGGPSGVDARVGRDGRHHPSSPTLLRSRIVEAIANDPGASLRTIGARVHASPETVRRVRRRLEEQPVLSALPMPDPTAAPDRRPKTDWSRDSACLSTVAGERFAAWFDVHHLADEALTEHLAGVPISRAYEVIDEARRRARLWLAFGDLLEARTRACTLGDS
jgi:ParB-like chromosome segregation protein Spo0J